MKKLLFICRGNMFRSPVAEAIFNADPLEGWIAHSYGTAVGQEGRQGVRLSQYGGGIEIVIEEMKNLGMDISAKYCDQILPEHLEDADKVIVMSEEDFVPKWLEEKHYERWEVPNPDFITREDALNVINLLKDKIEILKKSL